MKKLSLKEVRKKKKFIKAMHLMKKFKDFSLTHTYGDKTTLNMGGKYISKSITPEQAKRLFDKKILNSIRNSLITDCPSIKYMSYHEMINMILNGGLKNIDM